MKLFHCLKFLHCKHLKIHHHVTVPTTVFFSNDTTAIAILGRLWFQYLKFTDDELYFFLQIPMTIHMGSISSTKTRASTHGCMFTKTTSISWQIILQDFIFSDRRHNFHSTPEKRGMYTEKHWGWGTPSYSDRKLHFMLKFTHQIF